MNYFTAAEIRPGLFHIGEPDGVHFTLITGTEQALLFDAGYGFADPAAFVKTLTDLPVILVNSHGHLDHTGGNRFFGSAFAHPETAALYHADQSEKQNLMNMLQRKYALGKIPCPWPKRFHAEDYLPYDRCDFISLSDHQIFDLGDRRVEVIYFPGHTSDCILLYDHQTKIILSGDNISQSLWIMLDRSIPLQKYRSQLAHLMQTYEIAGILASHHSELYPHALLDAQLCCIDSRAQNSSPFTLRDKWPDALKSKIYAEGIGHLYVVYPSSER